MPSLCRLRVYAGQQVEFFTSRCSWLRVLMYFLWYSYVMYSQTRILIALVELLIVDFVIHQSLTKCWEKRHRNVSWEICRVCGSEQVVEACERRFVNKQTSKKLYGLDFESRGAPDPQKKTRDRVPWKMSSANPIHSLALLPQIPLSCSNLLNLYMDLCSTKMQWL